MAHYAMPDNKTERGIKSRSSLGGGQDNFNEIRFEDKMGHEQLFIHAEKDQAIEVENDETHWVGHDRTGTVDNDETLTINGKRTETVEKDDSTTITTGNQTTKINLGKIQTSAMQSIELTVGPSSIKLDPSGITIKEVQITLG